MPVATVSQNTEEFELKSLKGASVVLRRMSYGQKLHRQAMISNMKMTGTKKEFEAQLNLANEQVTRWEFRTCVVDHNLEDESGNKLNLQNAHDLERLDPRVGEEIASLIGKMNNFEDEDDETGN